MDNIEGLLSTYESLKEQIRSSPDAFERFSVHFSVLANYLRQINVKGAAKKLIQHLANDGPTIIEAMITLWDDEACPTLVGSWDLMCLEFHSLDIEFCDHVVNNPKITAELLESIGSHNILTSAMILKAAMASSGLPDVSCYAILPQAFVCAYVESMDLFEHDPNMKQQVLTIYNDYMKHFLLTDSEARKALLSNISEGQCELLSDVVSLIARSTEILDSVETDVECKLLHLRFTYYMYHINDTTCPISTDFINTALRFLKPSLFVEQERSIVFEILNNNMSSIEPPTAARAFRRLLAAAIGIPINCGLLCIEYAKKIASYHSDTILILVHANPAAGNKFSYVPSSEDLPKEGDLGILRYQVPYAQYQAGEIAVLLDHWSFEIREATKALLASLESPRDTISLDQNIDKLLTRTLSDVTKKSVVKSLRVISVIEDFYN